MDLWFLGAAAGDIRKQLRLARDSCDSSSDENSESFSRIRGRFSQKRKLSKEADVTGRQLYDESLYNDHGLTRSSDLLNPSCSGIVTAAVTNQMEKNAEYWGRDSGLGNGSSSFAVSEMGQSCERDNCSVLDSDASLFSDRSRAPLRIKCLNKHPVKPLTSLESCMLAHLYNEHAREEGPLSRFPSPARSFKPPVMDSSGIVRRVDVVNLHSFKSLSGKDDDKLQDSPTSCSISKTRRKSGSFRDLSGKKNIRKLQSVRKGFYGGASLFSLGMCVGLISSFLATRKEMERMESSLKQSEHLVQDLQEELEMKDSLVVKELNTENSQSQATPENLIGDIADYMRPNDTQISEDSSVSMSKIEAELEAELERLGLNMGSVLDDTLATSNEEDDGGGTSGASTTIHSMNYAVCPKELSLRLHEVVQSRLEARVRELEYALEATQKRARPQPPHGVSSPRKLRYASETSQNESESDESPCDLYKSDQRAYLHVDDGLRVSFGSEVEDGKETTAAEEDGCGTSEGCGGGSAGEDDEDEDEKELIKLLVQKTKNGSPFVLNAQKFLLSMDDYA